MLLLTIRTDKPEAEIGLYTDTECLDYETWLAHRELAETIHLKIKELLAAHSKVLQELDGIAVYQGPGSFTGLRIGISVANALAYALRLPIVGSKGDDWIAVGVQRLMDDNETDAIVLPEYGAPVHITQPKK